MVDAKITDLDGLARLSEQLRQQGKRVVLCHGAFDLMHTGHIRYLQRSRKEGDVLFVTVTADEFVNKGPGRPIFNQRLRVENLAALECVDAVAVNPALTAVDVLNRVKPSVYSKGSEYRSDKNDVTGNIVREQQAVEANGGRIFFTDEITFSSSSLLNEHFGVFPPNTRDFLERFRAQHSEKELQHMLMSFEDLNVLIVGDAIIDQYHYVVPLGQTGKGNVLAVRYETEEQFAGGAVAVANHVSRFVRKATLVTALGDIVSYEDYIRSKLQPNITPEFSYFVNAPTVTKRRFVDKDLAKLFEVYFHDERPQLQDGGVKICNWLNENLATFDVVIVADFGNGFISTEMIAILCEKARFLAVNTQVNSGNRGYHVINRYPRADFVSLNEPELRLSAHNRHDPLEIVCERVAETVFASQLAVTLGTHGVTMLDADEGIFYKVPALSSRVIDRVGAGDAFLSLAALSLCKKLPAEVAAFFGSVAAAMDVQIVCNREPIDSVGLRKYVSTLLK